MRQPPKTKKRAASSFDSMASAAASTGIPKDFIQWAKKNGCGGFKSGRIYGKELRDFFTERWEDFEDSKDASLDGSQEAVNKERVLMLRKQQRKLDQEYEIQTGQLVPIEQVKERVSRSYGVFTGIVKRTVSRDDWNAIARQFQNASFDL